MNKKPTPAETGRLGGFARMKSMSPEELSSANSWAARHPRMGLELQTPEENAARRAKWYADNKEEIVARRNKRRSGMPDNHLAFKRLERALDAAASSEARADSP